MYVCMYINVCIYTCLDGARAQAADLDRSAFDSGTLKVIRHEFRVTCSTSTAGGGGTGGTFRASVCQIEHSRSFPPPPPLSPLPPPATAVAAAAAEVSLFLPCPAAAQVQTLAFARGGSRGAAARAAAGPHLVRTRANISPAHTPAYVRIRQHTSHGAMLIYI